MLTGTVPRPPGRHDPPATDAGMRTRIQPSAPASPAASRAPPSVLRVAYSTRLQPHTPPTAAEPGTHSRRECKPRNRCVAHPRSDTQTPPTRSTRPAQSARAARGSTSPPLWRTTAATRAPPATARLANNPPAYAIAANPARCNRTSCAAMYGTPNHAATNSTFAASSFFHSYGRVIQNWRSPTSVSACTTRASQQPPTRHHQAAPGCR